MIKICPVCREDNLSNARFCSSCGSVIAHIEASFSGYGTSDQKEDPPSPKVEPLVTVRSKANADLASRLVAMTQVSKPTLDRDSSRKLFRTPLAVASLAGVTIIGLVTSLAWIMSSPRPLDSKGGNQSKVSAEDSHSSKSSVTPKITQTPAPQTNATATAANAASPAPSTLPATAATAATAAAVTQAERVEPAPKPLATPAPAASTSPSSQPVASISPARTTPKREAAKVDEAAGAEPVKKRSPPKEVSRQAAKAPRATSPKSEEANGYPVPQAIQPTPGPTAQVRDRSVPSPRAESSVGAAPAKPTVSAEAKPRESRSGVEGLCSDRTNFVTRGFCQSQYCTEAQRKNDPVCVRLRQTETARQSANY
jgi:hypothetical protein